MQLPASFRHENFLAGTGKILSPYSPRHFRFQKVQLLGRNHPGKACFSTSPICSFVTTERSIFHSGQRPLSIAWAIRRSGYFRVSSGVCHHIKWQRGLSLSIWSLCKCKKQSIGNLVLAEEFTPCERLLLFRRYFARMPVNTGWAPTSSPEAQTSPQACRRRCPCQAAAGRLLS